MKTLAACMIMGSVLTSGMAWADGADVGTLDHPKNYTYLVTVHTSFGTKFQDCFVFSKTVLTIGGLGTLSYTASPMMPKKYYTAVTSLAEATKLGATFAFAGFKKGTAESGELYAVGADEFHDSYRVTGTAVPACPTSDASSKPGANYLPPR